MGVEVFFVFHALISDLQFSPNSKHLNATDSAGLQRGAAAFGFFKKRWRRDKKEPHQT